MSNESKSTNNIVIYMHIRKTVYEIAVFVFLAMYILYCQIRNDITVGLWYFIVIGVFFVSIVLLSSYKYRNTRRSFCLFSILCITSGLLNSLHTDNSTLMTHIYTICSFGIAFLLCNESIHTNLYKNMFYYLAFVVIVHFLFQGFSEPYFATDTINFISVHLITFCVPYYINAEEREENIDIIPALLTWILSLIGGRSGIICATILFGLLILQRYSSIKSKALKIMATLALIIMAILIILLFIRKRFDIFGNSYGVQKFLEKGLDSGGRNYCWLEYVNYAKASVSNFVCGARVYDLIWGRFFDGNLHNSILFVHAKNGIIMFVWFVIMLVRSIIYGFINKKKVYSACLIAFFLRGFTDFTFWGTLGTPFMIFILYQPVFLRHEERRK